MHCLVKRWRSTIMGWEVHTSRKTGQKYYFNRSTGESVYSKPEDFDENKASKSHEKRKRESSSSSSSSSRRHDESGGDSKRRAEGGGSKARNDYRDDDDDEDDDGKTLTTSHILVKHTKSRKPKSWRSPDGITRTLAEARDKATKIRERLKKCSKDELPEMFAKIAKRESDCSSAKRGGNLGEWTSGRRKFMPQFEAAAAPLHVGQMSKLTETSSGVHIILRTK